MGLLICILIPGIAFVLGKGILRVLYGRKQELTMQDNFLVGGIVVIGLAEAANVFVAFLGRTLSVGTKLFVAALAGCMVVATVILFCTRSKKDKKKADKKVLLLRHQVLFYTFGILVVLQVVYIVAGTPVYLGGDMTMETVQSFLETDAAYTVNPMTGQPYELGMPSRLKLLCLPTLYAMLSSAFRVDAITVVWVLAPVFTLFGCYLVYSVLAGVLFPTGRWKRACFLLLIALLIWVGDYMLSVDGFNLLHAGYRGVTIRGAVLVPYTISLVLRKKWKIVILCVLAEACIVWTLYGMGACLLVAVAMTVTGKVTERFLKNRKARRAGKEDAVCSNS